MSKIVRNNKKVVEAEFEGSFHHLRERLLFQKFHIEVLQTKKKKHYLFKNIYKSLFHNIIISVSAYIIL